MWTLKIRDQGLATYDLEQGLAKMPATEVNGRTVWTNDARPGATILVADRVLVELFAWGDGSDDVAVAALAAALAELDVAALEAAAANADD